MWPPSEQTSRPRSSSRQGMNYGSEVRVESPSCRQRGLAVKQLCPRRARVRATRAWQAKTGAQRPLPLAASSDLTNAPATAPLAAARPTFEQVPADVTRDGCRRVAQNSPGPCGRPWARCSPPKTAGAGSDSSRGAAIRRMVEWQAPAGREILDTWRAFRGPRTRVSRRGNRTKTTANGNV